MWIDEGQIEDVKAKSLQGFGLEKRVFLLKKQIHSSRKDVDGNLDVRTYMLLWCFETGFVRLSGRRKAIGANEINTQGVED